MNQTEIYQQCYAHDRAERGRRSVNNREIQDAVKTLILIEEAVLAEFEYPEKLSQMNPVVTVEFQARVSQVIALGTAAAERQTISSELTDIYKALCSLGPT